MPHFSPGFFTTMEKSVGTGRMLALWLNQQWNINLWQSWLATMWLWVSLHVPQSVSTAASWVTITELSPRTCPRVPLSTWIIIDKRAATLCFPCQSYVWLTFVSLPSLNSIIGRGPVVNVSRVVILTDNVLYKLCFFFICFFVVLQEK